MSRFLKNRKLWFLAFLSIALIAFLYLQCYFTSCAMIIVGALCVANILLVRKWLKPLDDICPQRPIREVKTLIIGDICSTSYLSTRFDLSKSLIITAPDRSTFSSYMILKHVASRLEGNQVCIIAPKKESSRLSVLDIPYFSLITRLENNLKDNSRERELYILYHPCSLLKWLLGVFSRPPQTNSINKELIEYCKRKHFQLTFLQK